LGIGTSTPSVDVDIVKTIDSTFEGLNVRNLSTGTNATTVIRVKDNAGNICEFGLGGTNHTSLPNIGYFYTNKQILAFYANASERMRLSPNGNVLINTTTDAGFRLDVNGTARVQGNAQFGTGFYWDNTNNRLGINTSSPLSVLDVSGSALANFQRIRTTNTGAATNVALRIQDGTTGFTDADGLYLGRSAAINYLWTYESEPLVFGTSNSERMRIFTTGNVGINTTTDAGFRLDVNGTARVSGLITANGYRITTNGEGLTAANSSVGIVSYGGNGAASGYTFTLNNQYGGGNINRNLFAVGDGFFSVSALSSGTNTINWLGVYPVINNTGGTTTSRGIYYNPTLTNLTGTTHWAFHSTSGRIRFENLPTSATGLSAGDIWNDGGTLKIV
jgi:hypothetical protein